MEWVQRTTRAWTAPPRMPAKRRSSPSTRSISSASSRAAARASPERPVEQRAITCSPVPRWGHFADTQVHAVSKVRSCGDTMKPLDCGTSSNELRP